MKVNFRISRYGSIATAAIFSSSLFHVQRPRAKDRGSRTQAESCCHETWRKSPRGLSGQMSICQGDPREEPGRTSMSESVYARSCRLGSFIIFASLFSVVGVFLEARRPLYGSHDGK